MENAVVKKGNGGRKFFSSSTPRERERERAILTLEGNAVAEEK